MAWFKGPGQLPELRNYTSSKRSGGSNLNRRGRLPQIGGYGQRRQRGQLGPIPLIVGGTLVVLCLVLTARLWLPAVSWFIPDRYIMAYAPQSLQVIIFQIDPSEIIPTPKSVDESAAMSLLETPLPQEPIATSPPGTEPAVVGPVGEASAGYQQPTPIAVLPTPTMTPIYAQAASDPRAQDRENIADLSHVSHLLTGFNWIRQGANNCGPASISVLMSYWGVEFTQEEAASFLKPNPEDPNVSPEEIAALVATKGYHTMIRVNGNIETLKLFILAGYPILIETGYDPEPDVVGWTSHYLTLTGFSDTDQGFIAMDTYRRPNWFYPYSEIDQYWRQFNRRYIIVYRPDQAAAVGSIVGEEVNDTTMYTNALKTAQLELSLDRSDPFGWFNMGSSLTGLGRYEDAVSAFDQARNLGLPSRFLWYQFTLFEAYLKVGGDYNDQVIVLANDVLSKKQSEEAFYYKGMAYQAQGNLDDARKQFNQALRFNKNYEAAEQALEAISEN
ncbi:MAG: tetratricopeptide repeat protein [Anaerolineae bacterium]|nr:tetratricopeptide repeat protein [Anaerolineae bacterium]